MSKTPTHHRFYVVLDVLDQDGRGPEDLKLELPLVIDTRGDRLHFDSVVYTSMDDLEADHQEKRGAFVDHWHANIPWLCPECEQLTPSGMWEKPRENEGFCPKCGADFRIAHCDACDSFGPVQHMSDRPVGAEGELCAGCMGRVPR